MKSPESIFEEDIQEFDDEIFQNDVFPIEPWEDGAQETYHPLAKDLDQGTSISFKFGEPDPTELAALILAYVQRQAHGVMPVYDRSAVWYAKDGKLWREWTKQESHLRLNSWGRRHLIWYGDEEPSRVLIKSPAKIASHLDESLSVHEQAGFFADAPYGIAIGNAFWRVDLDAKELIKEPLTHEHRQTARVDLTPNPDGDAMLERILSGWFPDHDDPARQLLLEFLGISMLGMGTAFEKALVLYGPAGTGKSSVIAFMSTVLPDAMTSAVKLEHMGARFQDIELVNARINMCSELADHSARGTSIEHPDDIKALITGDKRQFEQKYKTPFNAHPRAGHVFAVNPGCFPRVSGADNPFRERWVCCPLQHRLRGTNADIKDVHTQAHIYGYALMMRCLDAARGVIERGSYTECSKGLQILQDEWFAGMDTVSHFVSECLEPREYKYEGLTKTEMDREYEEFCRKHQYQFRYTGNSLRQALARNGVVWDETLSKGSPRYDHKVT